VIVASSSNVAIVLVHSHTHHPWEPPTPSFPSLGYLLATGIVVGDHVVFFLAHTLSPPSSGAVHAHSRRPSIILHASARPHSSNILPIHFHPVVR
jgi:hypothetical protein